MFKDWHGAIAKTLREGQTSGVVRNDIDANETAILVPSPNKAGKVGDNSRKRRLDCQS
jgi:hypothetical protein